MILILTLPIENQKILLANVNETVSFARLFIKTIFTANLPDMAITAFQNMRPLAQLMFSIFIIIVSFLVFSVLSIVIAIPVFGFDSILSMANGIDYSDPEKMELLKFFQVSQSIGLFVIPPFIIAYLFYGNTLKYLYLKRSISINSLILVAILMVAILPFINFIGEFNANMKFPAWMSGVEEWMKSSEENAAEITEAFLKVDNMGGLFFNLIMIAVLPALGEELLFRGVIQRIFTNMTKNHHLGIWFSAIIFSAFHLQFYGFIPRLLLGVLFGYLLVWSGSMWLPIFAHFVNNGFATVAMYFVNKGMIKPEVEDIGSTSDSYYIAIISLVFVGSLLWFIKNQSKENHITSEFDH